MKGLFSKLGFIATILPMLAGFASATTYWSNAGTGDWAVDANWDTGHVPTSNDNAYVDNGGTALVTTSQEARYFTVAFAANSSGTVEIGAGGSLSGNQSANVGRKSGAVGTLTINGGTFVGGHHFYVGFEGGNGTVNIGGGGTATVTDNFYLSYVNGAKGLLSIDGGSLNVGGHFYTGYHGGEATVDVSNGGGLAIDGRLYMGYGGGESTVDIDGSGSLIDVAEYVIVGHESAESCAVNVTGGAELHSAGNGYMGNRSAARGIVSVSGTGSAWKTGGLLYVGRNGLGRLTITDGGLASAGSLTIDDDADGDGVVRMGTGGMLAVGDGGTNATTITEFLALLTGGTGNIEYWNGAVWSDITNGTSGVDYTLDAYTEGSTSYSRLTVQTSVPSAESIHWSNTGTGAWSNAANWDVRVPTCIDNAFVDNGGIAEIVTAQEANYLLVAHSEGSSGTVVVHADGRLTTEKTAHVGRKAGATGVLTVDGGMLNDGGQLDTGYEGGFGTINVTNGGTLNVAYRLYLGYNGGGGDLNVSGTDSVFSVVDDVFIGRSDCSASINITDGAVVRSGDDAYIGLGASATGTATVAGTNSAWNVDDLLAVAYDGVGTLTVSDGGFVSAGRLMIDKDTDGDGLVRMSSGAMLAVGDNETPVTNITEFLALVGGTDNLEYWNGATWDSITNGTEGVDYTLTQYSDDGTSYTLLTVFGLELEIGDISIAIDGSDAIISWTGTHGVNYALQSKGDLVVDSWSDVVSGIPGVNGSMSATSSVSSAESFYRVVVE